MRIGAALAHQQRSIGHVPGQGHELACSDKYEIARRDQVPSQTQWQEIDGRNAGKPKDLKVEVEEPDEDLRHPQVRNRYSEQEDGCDVRSGQR